MITIEQMNIPEKGAFSKSWGNSGVTSKLRKLKIGDSIVLPRSARNTVSTCAAQIGIKIVTRSLGSKDTFTLWRVE